MSEPDGVLWDRRAGRRCHWHRRFRRSWTVANGPGEAFGSPIRSWSGANTRAGDRRRPPTASSAVLLGIVHIGRYENYRGARQEWAAVPARERAPRETSAAAAIETVVHNVLVARVPAQQAVLDARYDQYLASVQDGPAGRADVTLGERVAARVRRWRDNDGLDATVRFEGQKPYPGRVAADRSDAAGRLGAHPGAPLPCCGVPVHLPPGDASPAAVSAYPCGKARAIGGRAAAHLQALEDVLQMGADRSFGDAQVPGDLAVGPPGRDEREQLTLPRGEGDRLAATLPFLEPGIKVRPQQREQPAVTLGEVRAGSAGQQQSQATPRRAGQAHHHLAVHPEQAE